MKVYADSGSMIVEYTGLNPREVHLLVVALNGIHLGNLNAFADLREMLAMSIASEAQGALRDSEEVGGYLGFPADNTADTPYELDDLSSKLAGLTQEKAAYLIGYAEGFWHSRSIIG